MTDITDELREWVMRNIANNPAPTGSIANTDASSQVSALSGKGGGRAGEGGNKRARATAQQGEEETCEPMGKKKAAEPKPRQLVGREVTTSNKGTRFRIYRVDPLLAVVIEDEE